MTTALYTVMVALRTAKEQFPSKIIRRQRERIRDTTWRRRSEVAALSRHGQLYEELARATARGSRL